MSEPAQRRAPSSPIARWLLLGAFVWLVVLMVVSPMSATVHGDGYYTYLWTRTMVMDGDLDFEGDYEICGDNWNLAHARHGDYINQWNPGPSIFWLPILAFDVLTGHPATRSADPVERAACHGPLAERAVRGSLLAGWLAILLGYLVARRVTGPEVAAAGAVVAGLFSPLAYYASLLPSYGHAASACMAGLAIYLWDRDRREPMRWGLLIIGAAIGLAMLTRPQNAILAILPGYTWLERLAPMMRARDAGAVGRHVALGFAFLFAMLLVFFPQMWWWHWQYGEWFFLPQGEHYMRWGAPRMVQVLFSTTNGLLPWSPVLYLSFFGLFLLAWRKQTRSLGVPMLLFVGLHLYVMAAVYDWWGAVGFPARRADAIAVPLMLGMAVAFRALLERARVSKGRAGVTPLAAAALALLLVVHGAWTTSVQVGVANALRTDMPHRSDQMWLDVWGRTSTPLWEAVGNPFAWPASLPFALRYRMPPRAWDYAGSHEIFYHEWLTLERRQEESFFDFVDAHVELLDGFDAEPVTQGARYRALSGYGRAIVPISWPHVGALRFEVRVPSGDPGPRHLWVWIDGEDLGSHRIAPSEHSVTVPLSGALTHQGICEVRLRVTGGPLLFQRMEILDPDPPPSIEEEERLDETGERRRAWRREHH